jgi:hypothetical protein
MKIHKIIEGSFVENGRNYAYSDDTNSVYHLTERGGFVSIRDVIEYDSIGNLIKYSRYLPEGILEYSIDELKNDSLLLYSVGWENVKDWEFVGNNKIANNKDTLEIETIKNSFGVYVYMYMANEEYRYVKIFEIFE